MNKISHCLLSHNSSDLSYKYFEAYDIFVSLNFTSKINILPINRASFCTPSKITT